MFLMGLFGVCFGAGASRVLTGPSSCWRVSWRALDLEEAEKIHRLRLVRARVDVDEDHHHRRAEEDHVWVQLWEEERRGEEG